MWLNAFLFISFNALSLNVDATNWREHMNWPTDFDGDCGENFSDRIIGGMNASIGQYPWIARLHMHDKEKGKFSYNCGGSLITDRHVLTAAHCVMTYEKTFYLVGVLLGDTIDGTDPDCENGFCAEPAQYIKVERIFVPSTYNKPYLAHDIALIKLAQPAQLNDYVKPICLPIGDEIQISRYAEVAGWGFTDGDLETVVPELQFAKLPIVPISECQAIYSVIKLDPARQICAGGKTKQDSCNGDSGGPFMTVMKGENGPRYYLSGVVSFGTRFCKEAPAIYTKVTNYLNFIVGNLHV